MLAEKRPYDEDSLTVSQLSAGRMRAGYINRRPMTASTSVPRSRSTPPVRPFARFDGLRQLARSPQERSPRGRSEGRIIIVFTSDSSEVEISLSQVDTSYMQSGAGPDILWFAAGDQPGLVWRTYQTPRFDSSYRSTTYDARGVGDARSRTEPPWPIADHAADAIELIEAVCTPPVFLVGLSMGSLIAQEICFTRPDLVRAAIVTGTVARKTGFIREWEQAEIDFRRQGGILPSDFAVAHYAVLMYPSEVLGDDELWEQLKSDLQRDFGHREGEMLAEQWQACLDYDSTERLPKCTVPLHAVAFSQDVQTPPSRVRQVAELAARGEFHLLEGLGHGSAFGHRPDVVNDTIEEILKRYA